MRHLAALIAIISLGQTPAHAGVITPGNPGTITSVGNTAGGGLTGGGTSGAVTLGLLTTCANTQVLAWNGSAWACASTASGITNSAGNNVIAKSNGTNIIASSLTDNGTLISTTEPLSFGNNSSTGQTLINGPTTQIFTVPSTSYAFGELNLYSVNGVVPAFPADLFVFVVRDSATADTTTHSQVSGGIDSEVTSTISAGGLALNNTAFQAKATGGTNNYAFHSLNGEVVFDSTGGGTNGNLTVGGTAFVSGSFLAAGPGATLFAENNGTNAIDISGTPTNAIHTRQATANFDVNNVATSTLRFYNANFGATQLEIGIGSTPTAGPKLSAGVPTVDHGAIQAGSTRLAGNVTGVGAFSAVVLTYPATPTWTRSWCKAQTNTDTINGQYITVTNSATAPTFNCKLAGAASNCNDFSWICIGE